MGNKEMGFKNEKQKIIAFKEVFSSGQGAKVLEEIKNMNAGEVSTFDADPIIMAYKNARRDAYLEILHFVNKKINTDFIDKDADADQEQRQADDESTDPLQ